MSLPDPQIFHDRYEIRSRLGRGGMADVYLGHDRMLERAVAIKVLFNEFATDPAFVERFRREAKAAANLTHPNIVAVYDWGEQAKTYYMVMEYVAGRSLADVLRDEGALPARRAAEIGGEVAAALSFAHRNGVIHRDIKPGNIIIADSATVKVGDFGIARAVNAGADSGLTQAGAVMGTAQYFSPEQAQGGHCDARSDLYSLGIVLYETVAGRPPFSAENPVSVAYKQVHEQPRPLRHLAPDVPLGYEAIVAKLLAKDPAARYQTADDLRNDLRRFREGQPPEALLEATGGAAPITDATPAVGTPTAVLAATAGADMATTRAMTSASPPTQAMPPAGPAGPRPPAARRPYPTTPSPPRKRSSGWLWFLVVLGVVGLAVGGWFLYQALADDGDVTVVTVPNVTGLTLEQAGRDLAAAGFDNVTPVPEANDQVGENVVWRQQPPAGAAVDPTTEVQVVYNPAKAPVRLGDLVGTNVDDARRAVEGAGLQVEVVEQASDRPAGEVIAQDPPAGTLVKPPATVTLTVSSGPASVTVPDVTGRDQQSAAERLESAGFKAQTVTEPSSDVDAGRVIRTNPAAGASVPKGTTVTMVVSSGPAPVAVPDVVGFTESKATDALQNAGLRRSVQRVEVPAGSPQDGLVIEQDPVAGTQLAVGQTVTITVAQAADAPTTTTATTTAP